MGTVKNEDWYYTEYAGQWKDGKKNDKGTEKTYLVYLNYITGKSSTKLDAQYTGQWKDDKKHGKGIKIYKDGRKEIGRWEMDEYVGDLK